MSKKLQIAFNLLFVVGLVIAYVAAWRSNSTANEAVHRFELLRPFTRIDVLENRVDTLVELQKKELKMVNQLLAGGMPSSDELKKMQQELEGITKPPQGW